MKVNLYSARKKLKLSKQEMARQIGICRAKYIDAENMSWIEDRYVYDQARKGMNVIQTPADFYVYTSFSLLLNVVANNLMMEGASAAEKRKKIHTQEDVAQALGISQPYVSMLLKKFNSMYDRKKTLAKLYDPYLQPFYPAGDGLYKRYVNDVFKDPDAPAAQAQGNVYSVLAFHYNLRMKKKTLKTAAEEMGMSLDDLQNAIRTNTLADLARQLDQCLDPFLVPFYQEDGAFHMVSADDDLGNILIR